MFRSGSKDCGTFYLTILLYVHCPMLALIHIYHLRSLPIKLRIFLHVVVQSQEYKAIETDVIDVTLDLSYHCYKVCIAFVLHFVPFNVVFS